MTWHDIIWCTLKRLYAFVDFISIYSALYHYHESNAQSTLWLCYIIVRFLFYQMPSLFTSADKTSSLSARWSHYTPEKVNKWAKKMNKFYFVFLAKSFSPRKSTASLRVYGKEESMAWMSICSLVKNFTQARERRWKPSFGMITQKVWYIPLLEVQWSTSTIVTLH